MTRPSEPGRDAFPEREEVQKTLSRWGTLPIEVAPKDVVDARHSRGLVTLRAAIGSAKRERQARRMHVSLGAAAAVALLGWAGLHHFGQGSAEFRTAGSTLEATRSHGSARSDDAARSSGPATQPGPASPSARQFFVEGSYEVVRSGAWARGTPSRELGAGDEVHALEEPIEVSLDRITSAHVAGRSVLAIAALEAHRHELRLLNGSADFQVDPKRSADVVVHAGSARIHVTGTAFSVTVGQGQKAVWSEVVVKVGHVEVLTEDRRFVLEAGDSWSSRDGTVRRARAAGSGAKPWEGAGLDSSGSPDGAHGIPVPNAPSGMNGGVRTSGGGLAVVDDATTTLSEENRLLRAALSARNGGSPARCVSLLSELLAKFPSSPLRQEAMVAQFRCQRSGGQAAAAHRTALRYLSEYPNGFARDEARSLVVEASP